MEKTAKVFYLLSEAGRKASLLQGGDGKELQVIEPPVTPKIIELATVSSDGEVYLYIGYRPEHNNSYHARVVILAEVYQDGLGEWKLREQEKDHRFDSPQTIELLLAWESLRQHQIAAAKELFSTHGPENEALRKRQDAERQEHEEKRRQENAERERKAAERKEKFNSELATWIAASGSDYLKQAHELGYKITLKYIIERAALEWPGYTLDDDYTWKERINPSPEALTEVAVLVKAGVNAEIVWLTDGPKSRDKDGYDEPFDPCEGIVIKGYLNHPSTSYDLVKIV